MFRKVSLGLAFLVAAILVTASIRTRVGLGDESEQSVLLQPSQPGSQDSPSSGGGAVASLSDGGSVPSPVAERAEPQQQDVTPRTSSRSTLADRIKRLNSQPPSSSPITRSTAPPITRSAPPAAPSVPSRRPGRTRLNESIDQPSSQSDSQTTTAAPPVQLNYTAPNSQRRPLETALPRESTAVAEGAILRSPGPAIVIEAVGPEAVQLGKPATYRISAVNGGSLAAQDVYVRLEAPSSAQILKHRPTSGNSEVINNGDDSVRIDWRIDELTARAHEQLEITLVPKTRGSMPLKLEWTMRPRQAVAQIVVQEPQLDLAVVGPRAVLYGETEVFSITISNPGNGPAENVVLEVATGSGPSESKRIGSIPAGGREVIKLELTAGQAGDMPIRASVRADGGLAKDFRHEVVVRRAKLEILAEGPGLKYAGAVATYSIRVRNNGDAPANEVQVGLQLPTDAKYLSGLTNHEAQGQQVAWRVGTLQPGDERVYKVRCELTLAGENRLDIVTTSADDLRTSVTIATRVEAIADLKLVVNDPQGPQAVGEEVEYEVMVLNRGTKSAQAVDVVAHFGEGVEPVVAEGFKHELKPGQVVFKSIPRIAPGQTMLLKIRAKASQGGDHRFRAVVKCSEPDTTLVAEETTRYFGDEPAATTARKP